MLVFDEIDRKIFLFQNGERRAIMNEYVHLMSQVEPPEEEAAAARDFFNKHAARLSEPAPAKKRTRTRTTASAVKTKSAASKAKSAVKVKS